MIIIIATIIIMITIPSPPPQGSSQACPQAPLPRSSSCTFTMSDCSTILFYWSIVWFPKSLKTTTCASTALAEVWDDQPLANKVGRSRRTLVVRWRRRGASFYSLSERSKAVTRVRPLYWHSLAGVPEIPYRDNFSDNFFSAFCTFDYVVPPRLLSRWLFVTVTAIASRYDQANKD